MAAARGVWCRVPGHAVSRDTGRDQAAKARRLRHSISLTERPRRWSRQRRWTGHQTRGPVPPRLVFQRALRVPSTGRAPVPGIRRRARVARQPCPGARLGAALRLERWREIWASGGERGTCSHRAARERLGPRITDHDASPHANFDDVGPRTVSAGRSRVGAAARRTARSAQRPRVSNWPDAGAVGRSRNPRWRAERAMLRSRTPHERVRPRVPIDWPSQCARLERIRARTVSGRRRLVGGTGRRSGRTAQRHELSVWPAA